MTRLLSEEAATDSNWMRWNARDVDLSVFSSRSSLLSLGKDSGVGRVQRCTNKFYKRQVAVAV